MLNNTYKLDELIHSELKNISKKDLFIKEFNNDSLITESEISSNPHIDKVLLEKMINEIQRNKNSSNPLKSLQKEKANSDFLYSNPDLVNLSSEESKRLLDIKENSSIFFKDKFNNCYTKTDLEHVATCSEYLYKHSLINEKSSVDEKNTFENINNKLNNLNLKIQQDKEIANNYIYVISILEHLMEINLENLILKNKFLEEISFNINKILNSSNLICLKLNDVFHNIIDKAEKILLCLQKKIEDDKINIFENIYDNSLKGSLNEVFGFIIKFSLCFKFSYGFLILIKYIKKFNFEKEFNEILNLSQILANNDNKIYNKGFNSKKNMQISEISFPIPVIYEKLTSSEKEKISKKFKTMELFEYLSEETSFCQYENTLFLYNTIYGLLKIKYDEDKNRMFFLELNEKAFDLKNGSIIALGKGESGLIAFIPNNYFSEETTEEIKILFSENINISNEEVVKNIRSRLNAYFSTMRKWCENSLDFQSSQDNKHFFYTDKKVKIPYDHISNDKKLKKAELLNKVKIYSKNNIIFCFRPISDFDKSKEFTKIYFSENYIYSVDIFNLDLNYIDQKENSLFELHHLKSHILKAKNEKIINDCTNKNVLNIIDRLASTLESNVFSVMNGMLTLLDADGNIFRFNLLLDGFEIKEKCFKNKGNCKLFFFTKKSNFVKVVFNKELSEGDLSKIGSVQNDYLKTFIKTKFYETNLPFVSDIPYESSLYQITGENFNKKNEIFEENIHKISNRNSLIKINIVDYNKNNNDLGDNYRDNRPENQFFIEMLKFLAVGSVNKLDETNHLEIEEIIFSHFLSFNDSKNMKLILDIIILFFEKKNNQNDLVALFYLLNVLKLFVNNNTRLNWDFRVYFNSQEEMHDTIAKILKIEEFLYDKIFEKDADYNNLFLKNTYLLIIDILFELSSFSFSDKNMYSNLFGDLMKKISDKKSEKVIFEELKFSILKNISKLFSTNNNYIIAFLLNEKSSQFIQENLFELLDYKEELIKKNMVNKNKNLDTYEEVFISTHQMDNFVLTIEKSISDIVVSIFTKILYTVLNINKSNSENNFENVIKNIFNEPIDENAIEKYKKKLIRILLDFSKKFLKTGLSLFDLILAKNGKKIHLLKSNFITNNINNILGFAYLINFDNFPEFIFENWEIVSECVKKISYLLNIENIQSKSCIDLEKKKPEKKTKLIHLEKSENKDFYEYRFNLIKNYKKLKTIKFKKEESSIPEPLEDLNIVMDNFSTTEIIKNKKVSREVANLSSFAYLKDQDRSSSKNQTEKTKLMDLFVSLCVFLPKGDENEIILEIENERKRSDSISFAIKMNETIFCKNFIIKSYQELPLLFKIKIKYPSDNSTSSTFYKLRISNKKFFDEDLSLMVFNLKTFLKKSIKFFSFYENANLVNNLLVNDSVKDLISSTLFSGGVKDVKNILCEDQNLNLIDKDLKSFFSCLEYHNKKNMEYLNDELLESDPFAKLKNNESESDKKCNIGVAFQNNVNNNSPIKMIFELIKINRINFEDIITIKDKDYNECEGKTYDELIPEKREFYLLNKLIVLFDFLIEKVNREFIFKGPIIDKLNLAIFFILINQDVIFINSLQNVYELLFKEENNYRKFTSKKLNIEDCIGLLERRDFELIFFIWKSATQIRKIFKNKKDLIYQELDENNKDKKTINLSLKQTDINFVRISCPIDPDNFEANELVTNYFKKYMEKLKLIFYLKSSNAKSKFSIQNDIENIRKTDEETKKAEGVIKKNAFYLKNLLKKSITGISLFSDKNKALEKVKNNVNVFTNNLINAVSNDEINPDNILACMRMVNVKIKFREISFFIINDLIKSIKDLDIKADLLNSFYNNFKEMNQNSYPNVLDNLHITSTEQSEVLTNLFHEYLYLIIEDINLLYNKKYQRKPTEDLSSNFNASNYLYLTILLNSLLWNIKGRNFQFLLDSKFFKNLFNNEENSILNHLRKTLFLNTNMLINYDDILIQNSITTKFNSLLIGDLLEEIFNNYSISIVRRIIKENYLNTNKQIFNNTKNKLPSLSRSMSSLDSVNKNELINQIMFVFHKVIEELLDNYIFFSTQDFLEEFPDEEIITMCASCFVKNDRRKEDEISVYFPENSIIKFCNISFYQKKISNICISLLKIILIKDNSTETIFKNINLFGKLLILALFANEKNVSLIFSILKIFISQINNKTEELKFLGLKLKEYYQSYILPHIKRFKKFESTETDLLQDISQNLDKFDNFEFLLRFILSITVISAKLRSNPSLILYSKEFFENSNNLSNIIETNIEDKILDFLRSFVSQSDLKESSLKVLSYLSNESSSAFIVKVIDSNIGYIDHMSRIVCNSKLEFSECLIDKKFDKNSLDNFVKKGSLIYDKNMYKVHSKNSDDDEIKKILDGNIEEKAFQAFVEKSDEKIINQIQTNKPDFLCLKKHEFIIDEEFVDKEKTFILADKDFICNILKILNEDLIDKNVFSLSAIQSQIRIAKFLKRILIYYNENLDIIKEQEKIGNNFYQNLDQNKQLIVDFFNKQREFFEHFLVLEDYKLPANIISINTLEDIFFGYKTYDIKMISKTHNEELLNFENPLSKEIKDDDLFPFGKISNQSNEGNKELSINIGKEEAFQKNKKKYIFNEILNKKTSKEIRFDKMFEKIYLKIDFENSSIYLKEESDKKNKSVFCDLKFVDFDCVLEKEEEIYDDEVFEKLESIKLFRILDKSEAIKNIQEYEKTKKFLNSQKEEKCGVMLTKEFLDEFDLLNKIENSTSKQIFKEYLKSVYNLNSCVFFIDESLFGLIDNFFMCFSIDFSLLDINVDKILTSPSEYLNLKKISEYENLSNEIFYFNILYYFFKNLNRFIIEDFKDLNKIKNKIKELESNNNESSSNIDKKDKQLNIEEEVEEDDRKIFVRYLSLINLELITNESDKLKDTNIENTLKFSDILDKIETLSFGSQTEIDIKKLGMHILKQHLRFISIFSVKDYALWEVSHDNIEETKIYNLMYYLKMLQYQSSFKSNYFNLQSENKMILNAMNPLIRKLLNSNKKEHIKILLNSENLKILDLSKPLANEADLLLSTPTSFLDEIFNNLNYDLEVEDKNMNKTIYSSNLEITKIILEFLFIELQAKNHQNIIVYINLIEIIIKNIEKALHKVSYKNHNNLFDSFVQYVKSILTIILKNKAIRAVIDVDCQKLNFSYKIIEFTFSILNIANLLIQNYNLNEIQVLIDKFIPKNKLELFESYDILKNKFNSKILTEKVISDNPDCNKNFEKTLRMPNIQNLFAFTLKDDEKLANYNVSFENAFKETKEIIMMNFLQIERKDQDIEMKIEKQIELTNRNKSLNVKNNNNGKSYSLKKRLLIQPENISKNITKNFAFVSEHTGNKKDSPIKLYNLPNNISLMKKGNMIYSLNLTINDSFYTLNPCDSKTTEKFIKENQLITKLFDLPDVRIFGYFNRNVLITNKGVFFLDVDSRYQKLYLLESDNGINYLELNEIQNPEEIVDVSWFGGILYLLESTGLIYSADLFSETENLFKKLNSFKENQRCLKIIATNYQTLFLIQDADGKKYPYYLSGISNSDDIGKFKNSKKMIEFENKPLKDFYNLKDFILFWTEDNEIYYCGEFVDTIFCPYKRNESFTEWLYPKNNNMTILNVIIVPEINIIFKLKNNKTNEIKYALYGQTYLFKEFDENFIKFERDPFILELDSYVKDNLEIDEKYDSLKNEVDPIIKSENNETKNMINDENKQNIEKNEEIVEEEIEAFLVSRYNANKGNIPKKKFDKKALKKPEKKMINNDDNKVNINTEEKIINEKDSIKKKEGIIIKKESFGLEGLVKEPFTDNLEILDGYSLWSFNHSSIGLNIYAFMAQEIKQKEYNYKILENKFKKDMMNIEDDSIQGEIIIIIRNKDNFISKLSYEILSGQEEFLYISLTVRENEDAYLLTPKLYKTKKEIIENVKFIDLKILEEKEKSLLDKISDDKNPLDEFIHREYFDSMFINIPFNTSDFINKNFEEIFNIVFISEDILIYKNLQNENYFTDKLKKHSKFKIKLNDIDIKRVNPFYIQAAEKNLKENYYNLVQAKTIQDILDAKNKYLALKVIKKENNKQTFVQYFMNNYKNHDILKSFANNLSNFEFLEKNLNFIDKAFQKLIDIFNHETDNLFSKFIRENLIFLSKESKENFIQKELEKIDKNEDRTDIDIDRIKAKRFENSNMQDKKFEMTIFSQVYNGTKKFKKDDYCKRNNKNLFKVELRGEYAQDVGGPGREIFSMMFEDLMSNKLDLLIPTQNQVTNSGFGRDLWTINPNAITSYHLDCYEFLGKVFAYSFISNVYSPVYLANFVWKAILKLEYRPEDIEEIDVVAYNSIVKVCLNPQDYSEELEALFDCANFTATLSNGEEIELGLGGRNIMVNENNYKDFIKLYLEARFNELNEQANAIRKGFTSIIPPTVLFYMNADDFNERVTGPKTFNLELFKENTIYEGYHSDSNEIKLFWEFIEGCSLEEKIQYLKFVWGRTTLPSNSKNFDTKHKIVRDYHLNERSLPVSHTCFFTLDLPPYNSYDTLRSKLLYAMSNSFVISDSDRDFNFNI